MQIFNSYDGTTGYLFSATGNFDFKFEGRYSKEQIQNKFGFLPENKIYAWGADECNIIPDELACWIGSMFLSSSSQKVYACLHFQDSVKKCAMLLHDRFIKFDTCLPFIYDEAFVKKQNYICLTGDILGRPDDLAALGKTFSYQRFFVPEIGPAINAVGGLVITLVKHMSIKPYRAMFFDKNTEKLPFMAQNFDAKLAHDASGKMAHLVASGVPAVNDICTSLNSSIYGKAVMKPSANDTGVYFVHETWLSEFFNEPKSIVDYLARYVPVSMAGNDKFKEHIQNNSPTVPVRIVNINDEEMLLAFCRFYETFAKKKVFLVKQATQHNWQEKVPVFRYNKGYMVPQSFVKEHYKE